MAQLLEHRERERWVLAILAQLPFLSEEVLEQLAGVKRRGLYPRVGRLAQSNLVAAISPRLAAGHSPQLLYLTDIGVTALAVLYGVEPKALAQRMRITRGHLLRLIPRLPALQATYRLLGAIAGSCPHPATLLEWERPWRRHYRRPTANAPVRVEFPAFAGLSWDDRSVQCLLVPDQGLVPLRHYRSALAHLLVMRAMSSGRVPVLVVATDRGRRTRGWEAMLQNTVMSHCEAPLAACVVNWSDLHAGLRMLPYESQTKPEKRSSSKFHGLPPLRHPLRDCRVPQIVGSLREFHIESPCVEEQLAQVSLALSPTDRWQLDFLGRHPFLSHTQLAALTGRPLRAIRSQYRRLERLGLIRVVRLDDVLQRHLARAIGETWPSPALELDTGDRPELLELTESGLALVAAQCEVSAKAAVRLNGLVGGGPEGAFGPRPELLRHLEHTVQANDIFVNLARSARLAFRDSDGDILVTWRSAAAAARGPLRPDWYAVVECGSTSFGFFLEYDRGTESARDYRRKFAAYFGYLSTGKFERDYEDFPMVLVVTTDNAAERRIAHAAHATFVGRERRLPLLLTSAWRIADKNNPHGLLGPIWWEPSANFNERRALPLARSAIHPHRVPPSRQHDPCEWSLR